MILFYKRLFPFKSLFRWLNCGDGMSLFLSTAGSLVVRGAGWYRYCIARQSADTLTRLTLSTLHSPLYQSYSPSSQLALAATSHFNSSAISTRSSTAPSKNFTHREFAFTLQNDAYLRYLSFATPEDLKKEVIRLNPARFEIGPVYTGRVSCSARCEDGDHGRLISTCMLGDAGDLAEG